MSNTDKYFPIQLHILHHGETALEALDACLRYGVVNTGERERQAQNKRESGVDDFETFLERNPTNNYRAELDQIHESHKDRTLFENAFMGRVIHAFTGSSLEFDVKIFKQVSNPDPKQVFFRIRADFMWGALYTARGGDMSGLRPLSWNEFRILAAILSGPLNNDEYTVLGWESIQARACGFHKKELLANSLVNRKPYEKKLPPHCQPLGRQTIRTIVDRLEVLGFFARVSFGPETAYSFRHESLDLRALMTKRRQSRMTSKLKLAERRSADRVAWESSTKPNNGKPVGNQSGTSQKPKGQPVPQPVPEPVPQPT